MEARAVAKYVRISPRKTRLVVDLIRGRGAGGSLELLEAINKRAAHVVTKVLSSAVANARQKELNIDRLWIKDIRVDGGPVYKRFMPRAMGRATMIRRPTSHITVVLSDEREKPKLEIKPPEVTEEKGKRKPRVRRHKEEAKKKEKGKKVKHRKKKWSPAA